MNYKEFLCKACLSRWLFSPEELERVTPLCPYCNIPLARANERT